MEQIFNTLSSQKKHLGQAGERIDENRTPITKQKINHQEGSFYTMREGVGLERRVR